MSLIVTAQATALPVWFENWTEFTVSISNPKTCKTQRRTRCKCQAGLALPTAGVRRGPGVGRAARPRTCRAPGAGQGVTNVDNGTVSLCQHLHF